MTQLHIAIPIAIPSTMLLWEFDSAPEELQALSGHGGDEDGILFVPKGMEAPWWLERLWSHRGNPQTIDCESGTVYIWAH